MKKVIYSILFFGLATQANGQVFIGESLTSDELRGPKSGSKYNPDAGMVSSILDFKFIGPQAKPQKREEVDPTTVEDFYNHKGIILSAVDKEPVFTITPGISSPNNGTFIYDRETKKVKMFENDKWVSLSDPGNSSQADANANTSAETSNAQGVIIGAPTSDAIGVLVLESPDKAVVLPRVGNPHLSVKNPYPGMLVYDTVSGKVAVFDGALWNYWGQRQPQP